MSVNFDIDETLATMPAFENLTDEQIGVLYADMLRVADEMGFIIERSRDPSMKFDVIYEMDGLHAIPMGDIDDDDYYLTLSLKKRLDFFRKHSQVIKSKSTSLLNPILLEWIFLWHGHIEPI